MSRSIRVDDLLSAAVSDEEQRVVRGCVLHVLRGNRDLVEHKISRLRDQVEDLDLEISCMESTLTQFFPAVKAV